MSYIFSSESVSEGHPDKLCDQLSDAILDAVLRQDPNGRAAVECYATTGLILIGGEVKYAGPKLDYTAIARKAVADIGYTDSAFGIDANSCCVLEAIQSQSPDIAQGVNKGEGLHTALGAGDQGIMFGYACNQSEQLMPLPIVYAHALVQTLARYRKDNSLPYLRPDAKAQVSIEYEGRTPKRIDTVVISTQHHPDVDHAKIKHDMINNVIKAVIPDHLLDANTRYHINPTGRFVIGGPHGDTGLTGRKIIVDTYGGWARHGGGAFSGKDCTKVDRSAAYIARYIAKNIVAAGLADEIEVQLAYAIGVSTPVSIYVDTKNTAKLDESQLVTLIRDTVDLTPEGIITTLKLTQPIFQNTAAYGHFGRTDIALPWESTQLVETFKKAVGSVAV